MNLSQYKSGSLLCVESRKNPTEDNLKDFFASVTLIKVEQIPSFLEKTEAVYNVVIDNVRDLNQDKRHTILWPRVTLGGVYFIKDARDSYSKKWVKNKVNAIMTTKETTEETDYESILFCRNGLCFEKKMRSSLQ